jgi:hypothetical protein
MSKTTNNQPVQDKDWLLEDLEEVVASSDSGDATLGPLTVILIIVAR